MDTEFTIEDSDGDTISFLVSEGSDAVQISIPINESTMTDVATVLLDKQDIARLVERLDLPEVTNE